MSSLQSQRGAVHILFLIFVLVIALSFGALWFVELQDNEEAVAGRAAAEYQAGENLKLAEYRRDFYNQVAPLAGGTIPTQMPEPADAMASARDEAEKYVMRINNDLAGVGNQVDDPAAKPTTLRGAWEPLITRYQALKGEIGQLKTEIERLKREVASRDLQIQNATSAHAGELQKNQEEWEATKSTLNSQLDDLRTQNDTLSNQVRETQDELASTREKDNEERRGLADKTEELESNVRSVKGELGKIKRARNVPDGKIIAVNSRGTCHIDVGSDSMLRRGTRFKVFEIGKGGAMIEKGWITVTNTENGQSTCAVDSRAAGLNIDAGDMIFNPVFSRGKEVRFAILGDLPGKYNKETAVRILGKLGARVEDGVSIATDFVVLGMKEGEDADEITDRDDYKNAKRWGIEMIRARDLQSFLQL